MRLSALELFGLRGDDTGRMPNYTRKVDVPGKSAQELYDRVSQDIDRFIEKISIGKYDLYRDPQQKKVTLKASMVTAVLTCTDGVLQLDAQLSLLAAPFRGKLDDAINRWLGKTFNLNT